MANFVAPNGNPIVAVYETTPCILGITDIDPVTGEVEYDGLGSLPLWNEQEPVTIDGKRVYLDEEGKWWTFDQLIRVKEGPDEPEFSGVNGDHPTYGSDDWRREVANAETIQGYVEWVNSKLAEARDA